MKKTGIIAFAYSFVISLSVIFIADSLFASKKHLKTNPVISNKNIVLFINKINEADIKSQPVKKIALNSLEKIPVATNSDSQKNTKSFVIEPPKPEDMVVMADNGEYSYDYFPLDIELVDDVIVKNVDEVKDIVVAQAEVADVKIAVEEIAKPAAENIIKPVLEAVDDYQVATQEIEAEIDVVESTEETDELQVAENEPTLLIPLEYGNAVRSHNLPKVVHQGEKNQVASANKNAPIKTIIEEKTTENDVVKEVSPWKTMAEIQAEKKTSSSGAWSVAIGSAHPKNSLVLEAGTGKDAKKIQDVISVNDNAEKNNGGEVLLAADMIDNIIIPIPEDIKNKKNLTPQLTSSEENKIVEEELDLELGVDRESEDVVISDAQGRNLHDKPKNSLLSSITSIFTGDKEEKVSADENADEESVVDNIGRKIGLKKKKRQILPTEIRLSFQPNRAEISGTTLQWIQAFGKKAAEEATVALEIRLDKDSSPQLQQKRLNLLSNILSSKGVSGHKLRVIYTAREPNSFVIRTIRINDPDSKEASQIKKTVPQGYYMQW